MTYQTYRFAILIALHFQKHWTNVEAACVLLLGCFCAVCDHHLSWDHNHLCSQSDPSRFCQW